MSKSPIHYGDSYKYGHSGQYPKMISMYDYLSSRGGEYSEVLFSGIQGLIVKYLSKPIKARHVIKLAKRARKHGIPFDFDGWMYIVDKHDGKLPIIIKALPEGTVVPVNTVLVTVESTDPEVPWIAGFVETLLMKVWYPTTVSTRAHHAMKVLLKYGPIEWAKFAYHAFGDRACTVPEAAEVAGFAHMAAGFEGTDNFDSLEYCEKFYQVPKDQVAGYSVYATEHSSTTSHGKDNEEAFVYEQLVLNNGRPIMSFVADSYDVFNFTDFCTHPGSRIRELVESRDHQKLILRPDSGKPIEVIEKMLLIMLKNDIAFEEVDGKILFKDFGILWGDGITIETIDEILAYFTDKGFSAMNFVFGSGGDLMQNVTRDTQKFAIKCSSIRTKHTQMIEFGGTDEYTVDHDVFKDPITDPGKSSMRGRVTTFYNKSTKAYISAIEAPSKDWEEALVTIFKNGKFKNKTSLSKIRQRALDAHR